MESVTIFLISSIALIIMPGPDLIYVLARGISGGKRKGAVSALGVSTGILIYASASALGLSLLLKSLPAVLNLIKVVGGLYLIFLGYRTFRKPKGMNLNRDEKAANARCFFQGLLSNILNPKIIIFFAAFLPQFVNFSLENYQLKLLLLGVVFALITLFYFSLVGIFSGNIGSLLKTKKTLDSKINIISGIILMVIGFSFLLKILLSFV